MKTLNIYLISDASGETINTVCDAVISQFEGVVINKIFFPLTRTKKQIDDIIFDIKKTNKKSDNHFTKHYSIEQYSMDNLENSIQENSIQNCILYTFAKSEILDYLIQSAAENNIICVCPIEHVTNTISNLIGILPTVHNPTKHPKLDDNYYFSIECINFAIQHDDGQNRQNYNNADIVILGPSRTSKSPISLYLSKYGYKVANIPYIMENEPEIDDLTFPIKIGLVISPEILSYVRNKRCTSMLYDENVGINTEYLIFENYSSKSRSRNEIRSALDFFQRNNIYIIDVSRKAVEEISAEIINIVKKNS